MMQVMSSSPPVAILFLGESDILITPVSAALIRPFSGGSMKVFFYRSQLYSVWHGFVHGPEALRSIPTTSNLFQDNLLTAFLINAAKGVGENCMLQFP